MRTSRGMGIMNKAKLPKAVLRKDADVKTKLYKKGGKVVGRLASGRPVVRNEDSSVSTHRMATGEFDGAVYNYPTMYGGKQYSSKEAAKIIKENDFVDPDTGQKLKKYPSVEDAETDYLLREHPQIDREASYINSKYKKGGKVKPGLYANIHAKQARIAAGSGEKMRKPGAPGAPTAKAFKQSAKTAKR